MKSYLVFLIAVLAGLLFASCSGSGGDDDDSDLSDDDSAQTENDDDYAADDDDDAGDDDSTEEGCGAIWVECEYAHPYDYVPNACGERVDGGEWEPYKAYWLCYYEHEMNRYDAIMTCGFDNGCDDWKYQYFSCLNDFAVGYFGCWDEATNENELNDCTSGLEIYAPGYCDDL